MTTLQICRKCDDDHRPDTICTAGRKKCPNCGTVGSVEDVFGFRDHGGRIRAQSYCRKCRSSKASNSPKPRKVPHGMTRDQAVAAYKREYPNDKTGIAGNRSFNYIIEKLSRKFGVAIKRVD